MWPDNWPAWQVFYSCDTQWRVGYSGAYGLDYVAVKLVYDAFVNQPENWPDTLESIRVMENAARAQMRKDRK